MDRRKFIKLNIAAGTVGATSLYGKPGSISIKTAKNHLNASRLILPLSKLQVPERSINLLSKYGSIWFNVLNNKDESKLFAKNPKLYFKENDISNDLIDEDSIEYKLLEAFTSNEIQKAAQTKKPEKFIRSLISQGIISDVDNASNLKNQILNLIQEESEHFSKITKNIQDKLNSLDIKNIKEKEINILINELAALGTETKVFLLAAVVLIIAAAVLIYVTVGAAVTVGLTAAVEVSVAVHQAVAVKTGTSISGSQNKAQKSSGKLIEALDPNKARDYAVASEIALLTGDKELLQGLDDFIFRQEVNSVFKALKEANFIQIENSSLSKVIDALSTLRLKSFIA